MKYKDLDLISIDIIRRRDLSDRLLAFYDLFGARTEAWFRIFSDAEVAVIVGWRKPNGEPNSEAVRQTRARLVKAGELEKVIQQQRGREFWSFKPAKSGLMDDEALAILSDKTPSITYCRASDRPLFELRHRIDNLPVIYLADMGVGHCWMKALRDLFLFDESGVLDFWEFKAINTISGKAHQLKGIEDTDLRLQVALAGLERGISRNLERNSEWQPEDHVAWALDALKRVGREPDWMPWWTTERVAAWRTAQGASGNPVTLERLARKALAELEKRAGLAAGAPDPRVARAVEEAKGRKQVAGKRRSSSATAALPELAGIREFTLPASRAKSPELVDATDVQDVEDEAVEQDGDQDEEFDWDEFTGTAAPSTLDRPSTPASTGADGESGHQGSGGDEEMSIFDRMEALVSVSTGRW